MEGRFADFDLGRRLGGGSFGEVHAAYDRVQKARVALKRLRHAGALDLYRFKKEFRALADIFHPNLVRLHELFEDKEQWYIAMELVDGVDIVSYARQDPLLAHAPTVLAPILREAAEPGVLEEDVNFERLRASFAQLAAGVDALHGAKRLHRDLKPSNVLVAADGTVKILDFGLVTELAVASASLAQIVGTPAYMAPEQARGNDVTPAADWYAVGVLLYEALLGQLPFDGEPMDVVALKQQRAPIHPCALEERLPADLSELCVQLLHRDPACRPAGAEVFDLLSAGGRPARRISSPMPRTHLVGRQAELKSLRSAFNDSRHGAVVVHMAGPSGNGKTSLLRAFVEGLSEGANAVVLEGRCYEGEGVPFKAVDTVMDAAVGRLLHAPATEIERILPRNFESLTRLFPVLKRLPTNSRQPGGARELHDPIEIRRRGFAALRDMVGRIAERRPVVVCIDDFQWGDLDSVALLADLVRPPDAFPILLVLSYRSEQSEANAILRALREDVTGERLATIDVGPLTHEESVTLAQAILNPQGTAAEGDLDAIARESGGSPLFVKELARHVLDGTRSTDDVSVDDLIAQRLERLAEEPRAVIEVIAIAANAVPVGILRRVAGLSGEAALSSLAVLKSVHLVRARREAAEDVIEAYHDRIRERVRALLPPEKARRWHGLLAAALEANADADPERIAIHYQASPTPERARPHAERAAIAASTALAFDRAAHWYELALGLTAVGHAGRRELHIKLGDALAFAGRGALAVPHLEAAAAESPPMEALELRRRAADQLLRSGHVDEGLGASRAVLASIGIRFPRTRLGAIVTLMFYRFVLALRGMRFRLRKPEQVTTEEVARVDTCQMLGYALGLIDPLLGVVFQTRALLFALRAGELERVTRAVANEAGLCALRGARTWRRTERLLCYANALADRSGSVESRAFATGMSGFALYISARYLEAVPLLGQTLDLLQDGSTGRVHEQVAQRSFLIIALSYLGRFRELRRQQEDGLREAIARGDLYGLVLMRTVSLAWLVADHPEIGERQAKAALAEWSKQGFQVPHAHGLVALILVSLYRDDPLQADALSTEFLERARSSTLWRVQYVRLLALRLSAVTAVHLAKRAPDKSMALLRRAAQDANIIMREGVPSFQPFATLVRAGIALRSGACGEAIRGLDAAVAEFEAVRMMGYAFATRDRAARLRNDGSTAANIEHAAAFFRSEEVVNPERFIAMLVPGFSVEARITPQ